MSAEETRAEDGGATERPPWGQRRPRLSDVRGCYRYILGREPESEAVLASHVEGFATMDELRAQFFHATEFRLQFGAVAPPVGLAHDAPALAVETEATDAEIERMLQVARRAWMRLGETAPHWSVLPDPRFRPEEIARHRRAFHATGREERAVLEGVLARLGLKGAGFARLVEFGCGVGRGTAHLAALCPEVTGVDFSAPHLDLAREEARARNLWHLHWVRARPEAPMPEAGYDIWFSRRALQHNPPPVIRRVLELAFAGLRPGGVAVFQLPTYADGYRFSVAAHLASAQGAAPEMHLLPQAEVFAIAAAAGLVLLEVREDAALPPALRAGWRSNLFVFRRPA